MNSVGLDSTKTDPSFALSEAVLAVKLGERDLARSILADLLQQEPHHEQALLWYAALARTAQEGIRILERLLSIHPQNKQARATLEMLRLNSAAASAAEESQAQSAGHRAVVCPLCDYVEGGEPARCGRCGAVHDLNDLKTLAQPHTTNEQLLLAGVQRWEQAERHSRTFDGQLNLAKAYLNLHRSNDAIMHLRNAVELRPDAHKVRKTLAQLRSRRLVLTVDDSVTIRRIVSILLERNGYRVNLACDGEEALSRICEEKPDLVLLDVVMPGLNGYQVCRAIRQDDRFTKIPVVILSSSLLDRIKGRLSGVTDYMSKPFEPEQLLRTMARHLASRDSNNDF